MIIEQYSAQYFDDVIELINNFYEESLKEYDSVIDIGTLEKTITDITSDPLNVFLLIEDGKCEGILAGTQVTSLINKKLMFQEIMWYVNKEKRRYGIYLLKKVEEILKQRGFETMIMALMENSKAEKIRTLYNRMGFTPFESHYIKSL